MKNPILLSIFLIILLATLSRSQQEITLQSQLNEVRKVNLFEEFGIATGNYQINPPTASAQLEQPLDVKLDNAFFAAPRSLISSSLVIDSQTTQQLQIYSDLSKPVDQQDQKQISLVQIQTTNGQTQITELAQLNLSAQLSGAYSFEVALFAQSQGIILYQIIQNKKESTCICLISLDAKNNFILSTPINLAQNSMNLQANFGVFSNKLYYIVQEKTQNIIHLRQIDLGTQTQVDLSEVKVCSSIKTPKIVYLANSSGYLLQCINLDQMLVNYSYNFIDTNQNVLATVLSEFYDYSNRTIRRVNVYQNQIYIISTVQQIFDQINITILNVDKNTQTIGVSTNNIEIPVNNMNLYGTFITDQGLISLVASNLIIGISLKNYQIVFQIQNQPIYNYEIFTSNIYGNQIAIQYDLINSNDPTFTTKIITPGIPKLSITQISDQAQIYTLNYDNDVMKRTMTVTANLIASDSNLVIVKNSNVNVSSVILDYFSRVSINMDNYVIGYVKQATLSEKFDTPSFMAYNLLFKYSYAKPVSTIYSTSNSYILVITVEKTQNVVTLSYPSESQSQLISLATIKFDQPIIRVDNSGFFSTNDSTGKYKQIYVYYSDNALFLSYEFKVIPQVCESTQDFLFSGDSINNLVVVLCDKVLTVYQFNQQNTMSYLFTYTPSVITYPAAKFVSDVVSIELRSNGMLYLTDLQTIMAVNICNKYVIGQVQIPPNSVGQFFGKVIFFYDTFIVVRIDQNQPSIIQYSYNNFDGTTATPLRTLLTFNYKWTLNNDYSGVSSIINNSNENQDEEFLIINAENDANTIYKLFYRISKIQAQNQLLTYLAIDPNTPFYAIPNQIGYINQNNLLIIKLNYNQLIAFGLNISSDRFQEQISGQVSGQITANGKYSFNLNYNYQRNVNTYYGEILNNDSVQQFKAYFQNTKVVAPLAYPFNDKQFTNSHLFGWQKKSSDFNFNFDMNFIQRVDVVQNTNLPSSITSLEVMPNAMIYFTTDGIDLEGASITDAISGDCQFFKEEGKQDISIDANGKTVVKSIVYSLTKDYTTSSIVNLSQYTISGTYDTYPTSKPVLKILSTAGYKLDSYMLLIKTINRVLPDATLGLLALLQNNELSSTQVCKLNLDQANSKFSFDCDIYQSISNLFIANIVYIASANQNVFVTFTDQIYYGFSADLTTFTQFNFKQFIILQGKQLNPTSTLNYAIKISDSTILVSYAGDNMFILMLDFISNKISINTAISTLYQQQNNQFLGSVLIVSPTQLLLLFQNVSYPNNYFLCLYEQYFANKSDYLIRSSYFFKNDLEVQAYRINKYNSQVVLNLSYVNNAQSTSTVLSIIDQPTINILTLKYNQATNYYIPTFNFAISPLYQDSFIYNIRLSTTVTDSTGGSVSKSSILQFASYLAAFILFVI